MPRLRWAEVDVEQGRISLLDAVTCGAALIVDRRTVFTNIPAGVGPRLGEQLRVVHHSIDAHPVADAGNTLRNMRLLGHTLPNEQLGLREDIDGIDGEGLSLPMTDRVAAEAGIDLIIGHMGTPVGPYSANLRILQQNRHASR